MKTSRLAAGWVLLLIGVLVILYGYSKLPDAATCQQVAQIYGPGHCSSTPGTGYFVFAGILAVLALGCFSPWLLKWLGGK